MKTLYCIELTDIEHKNYTPFYFKRWSHSVDRGSEPLFTMTKSKSFSGLPQKMSQVLTNIMIDTRNNLESDRTIYKTLNNGTTQLEIVKVKNVGLD